MIILKKIIQENIGYYVYFSFWVGLFMILLEIYKYINIIKNVMYILIDDSVL